MDSSTSRPAAATLFTALARQGQRVWRQVRSPARAGRRLPVADLLVRTAPDPQTTLDLFRGEWASRLPGELAALRAGQSPLFDDPRVTWALTQWGGVEGRSVLELGPLEGGHSAMFEKAGASRVLAVEANSQAYLKCLIIKELLHLRHVEFLLGDFVPFLQSNETHFDACSACGVLYHMSRPAELIAELARVAPRVFVWTHYYDEAVIARHPELRARFFAQENEQQGTFRYTAYRHAYRHSSRTTKFWGGNEAFSSWMRRDELLACFEHVGFRDFRFAFDEPHHPNGPALAFTAEVPGPRLQ